jgi:hemerythrin superfamily protein
MDITRCLKTDHAQLRKLARQMSKPRGPDQAKQAYTALRQALTVHSRAEEVVVYGALDALGRKPIQAATREGAVEHDLCDHLMGLLARGSAESPQWRARAMVVYEMLDHHLEEEEEEMFKWLNQHFDAPARQALGDAFVQHKGRPAR